ncbi:hypothetical protein PISS_a3134 [Pseudoalteromonas issachenkonii]|uniref:Uncharacterized protein n=1 Tax=Pseudoalteromonas issachenkonii TaxID=152297 RepID=A0ABN5C464_9GAMM|nr:hypothetical protein PISS_a3134 [Pseudoalteromonas issachenkonii]
MNYYFDQKLVIFIYLFLFKSSAAISVSKYPLENVGKISMKET